MSGNRGLGFKRWIRTKTGAVARVIPVRSKNKHGQEIVNLEIFHDGRVTRTYTQWTVKMLNLEGVEWFAQRPEAIRK